jgi:hypothetical protein
MDGLAWEHICDKAVKDSVATFASSERSCNETFEEAYSLFVLGLVLPIPKAVFVNLKLPPHLQLVFASKVKTHVVDRTSDILPVPHQLFFCPN